MAAFDFDVLRNLNTFSIEDLETASIHSAAPSYISDAPSYHTSVSNTEPIPPYSPPVNNTSSSSSSYSNTASPTTATATATTERASMAPVHVAPGSRAHSVPSLLPSHTAHIYSPGLPPIPPLPRRSASDVPSLGAFHIAPWSTINKNPTYQRVATRRAQAAMSSAARALERVNEEGGSGPGTSLSTSGAVPSSSGGSGSAVGGGPAGGLANGSGILTPGAERRIRPLEDPYLVGEEAAARARRERLARENGDDVLYKEDRRWDWFLAQMKDWDERDASWKYFHREMQNGSRGKLARLFGPGR